MNRNYRFQFCGTKLYTVLSLGVCCVCNLVLILTLYRTDLFVQTMSGEFSVKDPIKSYGSTECQTSCQYGKPCEYMKEVHFRVIVLTFDRAESLKKCLNHLRTIKMGNGELLSIEIWIDKDRNGYITN